MSPADSHAYSHVPYIPYLLHIPMNESQECQWQDRCRFPEKTSKWWISQLVCQPRPLSLITHASRGSVAQLEQMADLHWLESPPRLDHSLYVYYTCVRSASDVLSPLYKTGTITATKSLCNNVQVQGQRNALPPPAQFQFPPLSPPASALPIPSCLRTSGEPTRKTVQAARKNGDPYTYAHAPPPPQPLVPAPSIHPFASYSNWPPVAPPASSLPTPSWYSPANTNARVSSKDRAHRQDVKERRRARRSSPTQTPHPFSSKSDKTPSVSPVLRRSINLGYSPYMYGAASEGFTKGRKPRRSCFTPKDTNRQMNSLALSLG